ncbi:MAG: SDR family oxidoreductase [Bdellovibrionales bacterium]|nr:SDR family oxidoreductase [Bdellovibrionales bacterium]
MPKPLQCPAELLTLDLVGRTYVVTGGNSGIGLETVRQLAKQGAKVILACRRVAEGEKARKLILEEGVRGSIEVAELDLAHLDAIRKFSSRVLENHKAIHGLINNAGIMNPPKGKTQDGFELQFGTNHLGHYLLTELLLPALKNGAPSRVVNVSSCFHDKAFGREGKIDFDDLQFEKKKYDGWEAYAQSKLANLLHAKHLAKRLNGTGITAASVHPGWVRSNLIKFSMPVWMQNTVLKPLLKLAGMIEPWQGAQSTLFALLSPEAASRSGAYFSQVGIYREKKACAGGWPMESPNPHAHDAALAERLDAISRELVALGNSVT